MRGGFQVEMDMGPVEVGESLDVGGEAVEVTPASVGNPHAVVQREPDRETLLRLGPLIENHERFPERTNVQLVRVDGPSELTVGVWERGAGDTLVGTSAVACAAVAVARGWCTSPVTVHLAGGDLVVELDDDWNARLTGPAQEIFAGETAEEFAHEIRAPSRRGASVPVRRARAEDLGEATGRHRRDQPRDRRPRPADAGGRRRGGRGGAARPGTHQYPSNQGSLEFRRPPPASTATASESSWTSPPR